MSEAAKKSVRQADLMEWITGEDVVYADKIRVGVTRPPTEDGDKPDQVAVFIGREVLPGISIDLVARLEVAQAEDTLKALRECIDAVREGRLPHVGP